MLLDDRMRLIVALCVLTGAFPASARFPVEPIRFILPFPPGGGTDATARAIGDRLSEQLGQQIVIDNRPGCGANIGVEIAARMPPHGHTWFMATVTHTINTTSYRKLGYNLTRDFAPVSSLGSTTMVVIVHPSIPARSVKELIAIARARRSELTHSSPGTGTIGCYDACSTSVPSVARAGANSRSSPRSQTRW
jgi:tripartite-type tricarboxylate transporter receptor subunit TctC